MPALADAAVDPQHVDYINAHGTRRRPTIGPRPCDQTGPRRSGRGGAHQLTKSMIGHATAPAPSKPSSRLTLRDQIIHPMINYEAVDPTATRLRPASGAPAAVRGPLQLFARGQTACLPSSGTTGDRTWPGRCLVRRASLSRFITPIACALPASDGAIIRARDHPMRGQISRCANATRWRLRPHAETSACRFGGTAAMATGPRRLSAPAVVVRGSTRRGGTRAFSA